MPPIGAFYRLFGVRKATAAGRLRVIFDALVAAYLARHGWRALLGAFAIAIGVASALAADIGAANTSRAAQHGLTALGGDAQIVVDAPSLGGVPERTANAIAATPGVLAVRRVVLRAASVGDEPVRLVAVDSLQPFPGSSMLRAFGPGAFTAPGNLERSLVARGGAILSRDLARRLRVRVDSPLVVRVAGAPLALRVAAIFDRTPEALDPQTILVDLATVPVGRVDRVDVVARDGRVAAVRSGLATSLGRGVRVDLASGRLRGFIAAARSLGLDLHVLAWFALVVGGLVTVDAVASGVRARRPQIATLRMLGATRSAIARAFALEALLVGICGAVLGVLVGAALVLQSSGPDAIAFAVADVLLGLRDGSIGIAVAVIAALAPAIGAASVPPILGLRVQPREGGPIARRLAVIGLVTLGVALTAAIVPIGPAFVRGTGAISALGLGCVLWLPIVLIAIGGVVAANDRFPLSMRLAAARLKANALRSSVAAAGLASALAASLCASMVAQSFRASIERDATRHVPGDLFSLTAQGARDAFERSGGDAVFLAAASFAVAMLATLGSLASLVLERRRDLELVRILGLSTAALRAGVVYEAAAIAGTAAAFALPLGVGTGAVLILVLDRGALGWDAPLVLPVARAALLPPLAIAVAALGAIVPAARLGKLGRRNLVAGVFALGVALSLGGSLGAIEKPASSSVVPGARRAPRAGDRAWSVAMRLRDVRGRRFFATVTLARYDLATGTALVAGALSIRPEDASTPLVAHFAERGDELESGATSRPWSVVRSEGATPATFVLVAEDDAIGLDLRLVAERPPFAVSEFHGTSYPRLEVSGLIVFAGRPLVVTGGAWLEESDSALLHAACGVERYGLSFADGRDLEIGGPGPSHERYAVWTPGGDRFAPATQEAGGVAIPVDAYLTDRTGRASRLSGDDVALLRVGDTRWHSPHDRASYPEPWALEVPTLGLGETAIEPVVLDQEVAGAPGSGPAWFGAVDLAQADPPGLPEGFGFAELSGFALPSY